MINRLDTSWLAKKNYSEQEIDDFMDQLYLCRAYKISDVKGRVDIFLRHQKNMEKSSITAAAKSLNMSERTLSRRLKKQNTSFQQLLNNERKRRCFHYLQNDIDNGAEISQLLGFSNPAYFYQAFKQWTQLSFTEAKKYVAENRRDVGAIFDLS